MTQMVSRFFGKLTPALFLLGLFAPASSRAGNPAAIVGDWVMHLYLGPKLFDDRVHLEMGPKGELQGTLTVPDRFTVPLRNIKVTKKAISFDIEADEGRGPFHVKYEGQFHKTGTTFIGYATVTDDNSLLGGFVGQKQK